MISRNLVLKVAAFSLILGLISPVFAQRNSGPRQEKLLNGLKLLMWPDQSADKVTIKVRIHSGTSFDQQGKEGVMALLAESFYPNDVVSREFFKEDLGGTLSVTANYDYIQISASAKHDEFLTLLESVSSAISNPTIDKETTPKLVERRLAKLKELEADPVYIADRAASERLFGTFPYGRPELGTTETVSKLSFADLLEAKQRFLGSDNATVAISGKFDPALAYRAARRYLGSWIKSDKLVPSTFRQPDAPDPKLVTVATSADTTPHTRFALRGLARSDKDYPASSILTFVLEDRLRQNTTDTSAAVRHCAHILPGVIVFKLQDTENVAENLPTLLLSKPISGTEFDAAKSRLLSSVREIQVDDLWLDVDTFKIPSGADRQKALEAVTLADVQRVAERLSKNPVVAVTVAKAEKAATN